MKKWFRLRHVAVIWILGVISGAAQAQWVLPTAASIGGMTTSGSNATDPVTFPGVVSGTAYRIGLANALSFPTFDSGTAGDTLAIGRSALGGTAPSSAAYQAVAVGALAMSGNGITTAAIKNTAVGYNALAAVTSGANSTSIGHGALAGMTKNFEAGPCGSWICSQTCRSVVWSSTLSRKFCTGICFTKYQPRREREI